MYDDLPISLGCTESSIATELYKDFIDPDNIVQALELLSTMSGNEDLGSTISPVSKSLNPFLAPVRGQASDTKSRLIVLFVSPGPPVCGGRR